MTVIYLVIGIISVIIAVFSITKIIKLQIELEVSNEIVKQLNRILEEQES